MKNISRFISRVRCELSWRHDWQVRVSDEAITHTCKRCGKIIVRKITPSSTRRPND